MVESDVLVSNELGLHLRAATSLATTARKFLSEIRIAANDELVDVKSVIHLLMLGLGKGSHARLLVDGSDEDEAHEQIRSLFDQRFGEAC